jgi:hypothetical protein
MRFLQEFRKDPLVYLENIPLSELQWKGKQAQLQS